MGRFLLCCKCIKVEDDHNAEGEITRSEEDAAACLRSRTEVEQSKHAIVMAVAAAAAADPAVTAAQAAVAVVRLTSKGSGGCKEKWAAVKIQSAFRGHLAKRALRALRSLVKLQAFVKGYLVRKQTASTLQSLQALMRVQTAIKPDKSSIFLYQSLLSHRRSLEREQMSSLSSPKTIKMTCLSSTTSNNVAFSPPLPLQIPSHLSIPKCQDLQERSLTGSARSTPRCPSYMASTRSFDAKVRSQSVPRRRPEQESTELIVNKRASLREEAGSRASLSGPGTEAALSLKNAVTGILDGSLELNGERASDSHLMKRW